MINSNSKDIIIGFTELRSEFPQIKKYLKTKNIILTNRGTPFAIIKNYQEIKSYRCSDGASLNGASLSGASLNGASLHHTKIIESVPNFSTSDPKILKEIIKAIEKTPTAKILDYSSDEDHNRSVITLIGNSKSIVEAMFNATKIAGKLINIEKHQGLHPFIGATDVIPLVPLKNSTFAECKKLSEKLAKKIAKELKIPTYLYEKSAKKPQNKNLANIRKGRYETLKQEIKTNKKRFPDFGPKKLNKAGATAIGARKILIAFNVNLKSLNRTNALFTRRSFNEEEQYVSSIKQIAKTLRPSNNGFPALKALGLYLKSKKCYQISMNFTDFKKTNLKQVFDFIKKEAKKYNLQITESELIGLAPKDALPKNPRKTLLLKDFNEKKILENHL